jgi:hypothetical protein
MNRPLPARDRGYRKPDPGWASGPGRTLLGAGRLVRGTPVATSQLTLGQRCATFCPRSFGRRRLGVCAHQAEIGARSRSVCTGRESASAPEASMPKPQERQQCRSGNRWSVPDLLYRVPALSQVWHGALANNHPLRMKEQARGCACGFGALRLANSRTESKKARHGSAGRALGGRIDAT